MKQAAGVGRHRLEVAPLGLGVEGAERQGRLARAAYPGEDDEGAAGDADVYVLEIVDPGAADVDEPMRGERRGGWGLSAGHTTV